MPFVRKVGNTPNTAEASAPPEAPSKFDNLRNWLGTGVRLGSGLVANAGGWPGALAGGGGELIAEAIEGSLGKSSFARVGTEAAIGSIPLGKTLSAGRALKSAAKGAGFNVAGDVMRQGAEGNFSEGGSGWDTRRTAYAGAGGAAINGLLGKFAPGMPKESPIVKPNPLEAVDNAGRTLPYTEPGRANVGKQYTNKSGYSADPAQALADGATRPPSISQGRVSYGGEGVGNRTAESASSMAAGERAARQAERAQAAATNSTDRAARMRNTQEQEIRRAYGEAVQEDELRALKEKLGLRRTDETIKSYSERLNGSTSDGRSASATINWANEADAAAGSGRIGDSGQPTAKFIGMQDDGRGGSIPLYNIVGGPADRTTVSAAGLAKYGIAVPEAPAKGVTDDIPFDSPGGQGANWVDEQLEFIDEMNADQAPSKFGGRKPRQYKPKPSVMKPASSEEQSLTELLNFLDVDAAYAKGDDAFRKASGGIYGRAKAQAVASNSPLAEVGKTAKGKGPNKLNSESGKGGMFGSGSETGAINPELMSTIAGGSIGGLVDAAWGDDSNPIEGILAGAAIGGGVAMGPQILKSIGKTPEILQTPEGRKQAAEEFVNMIPQFQRFAYLSDARGLPANAIVGPYGAVLTGAIESILSGDKRGWALLKEARNPLNFLKEMHTKANFNESMRRLAEGELGRAEGMPFGIPKGMPKSLEEVVSGGKVGLSFPGVYMNMGDLQARRMLQRAGFSDDEARRMTLTAEPRTSTGKDIANMGRSGSPVWNIAFPFKRTPANIMEEGTSRTPGLGSLVDYLSGKNVTAREQIVQQAGGLGAGVAGYQLGQELDDPRSNWQNVSRRVATNAAGRYGLPAHIGVLLGQTVGQGKGVSKQKVDQMFDTAIPVPSLDTFTDVGHQVLFNEGEFRMPRGFRPFRPFGEEEPSQSFSRYVRSRRR